MTETQQELIRAVREEAWAEGYEACYKGEQRHNPYRAPRRSEESIEDYTGSYGSGNSQPYS